MTLKRLRIGAEGEGVGRGVLFPRNGREILFEFKENLTEVEKNEEEEEHNDGQVVRLVAIVGSLVTKCRNGTQIDGWQINDKAGGDILFHTASTGES